MPQCDIFQVGVKWRKALWASSENFWESNLAGSQKFLLHFLERILLLTRNETQPLHITDTFPGLLNRGGTICPQCSLAPLPWVTSKSLPDLFLPTTPNPFSVDVEIYKWTFSYSDITEIESDGLFHGWSISSFSLLLPTLQPPTLASSIYNLTTD